MDDSKGKSKKEIEKSKKPVKKKTDNTHVGSSNAFEKTENTFCRDDDNISDEKLDELVNE
jgi:hypothetical protein